MASTVEQTAASPSAPTISTNDLGPRIIDALAQVRAMTPDELHNEINGAGGGDCVMDSKEAEVVISILERHFNRELAKVEDLEPEQMNTLNALRNLIDARLRSTSQGQD